jgi:pimeloyl-ACP methyl ester carboxylesterase
VSRSLQANGYEVAGLDFAFYSQKDYDLKTLANDSLTITQTYAKDKLPVILAGWSTGAEQVVAAASGLPPMPNLAGLLLVSPGNTGGYGPCATNYIFWNEPASKLFTLTALAPKMPRVRIVQWHAEFDPLDSTAWLTRLRVPYQEHDFPNAIHDFHGACPVFLSQLDASISWILQKQTRPAAITTKSPHVGGRISKADKTSST